MKKLIVTSMLLFLASTTGFAADVWITSKIKTVYPLGDGSFILTFNDSPAACTNTATPNKHLYITANQNGVTEEGSKKMYAAALTAAASGKDVNAVFSDSTVYCYINRLSVVFN